MSGAQNAANPRRPDQGLRGFANHESQSPDNHEEEPTLTTSYDTPPLALAFLADSEAVSR